MKNITTNQKGLLSLNDVSINIDNWDFVKGNSLSETSVLNPNYVTGLVDAEGSFQITLLSQNKISDKSLITDIQNNKLGTEFEFKVTQKSHSVGILHELIKFFGCGRINIDNRTTDTKKFLVRSREDLIHKVFPHFKN